MRIAISSAYPADDIIATVGILISIVVAIVLLVEREKRRYRARHYAHIPASLVDARDHLRRKKEQDAKDQETLDRATEYHNGI